MLDLDDNRSIVSQSLALTFPHIFGDEDNYRYWFSEFGGRRVK
jgi:hypothetical protein